jgi:hypothetical protein
LLAISLAALPLAAHGQLSPGDPFGGDDGGCVPLSADNLRCGQQAAKAVEKLRGATIRCHTRQADARFGEVSGGGASSFDEERCEAAARAKLDGKIAKLAASGRCAGSAVLASVATHVAELTDDQSNPTSLDALGGALYCDATSGVAIDPGGDDAGYVPSIDDHLQCGDRTAKSLAKLAVAFSKCHRDLGSRAFNGATDYDDETCEAQARARFDDASAQLVAGGGCPSCLDGAALATLADDFTAALDSANAAFYPCPDPVLHVGTPSLDRATLIAVGIVLPITGDVDRDASVAVRYRPLGNPTWRDALPLLRVLPETVDGRTVAEQFAGSIFDLRPATTYEIELHAVDADGAVDETIPLTATTRALPTDPAAPNVRPVANTAALAAALADAAPGDVISLADGVYTGPFELAAAGTAANPIVIRGTSTNGTILDGGACDDCNVLEVYGAGFVHVERLTLRAAQRAIRFQTAAAEANVLRRVRIEDVRLGVGSREGQRDFYICDNELEGRLVWPQNYFDDGGAHSDDDGIHVEGDGHVVCHNDIIGFGDAVKNGQDGSRAFDVYGNEVRSAYDNGVELDYGEGNVRALRNRFTDNFVPISFQPILGGPAYAIRNVAVNIAHEQLKFHGVGGDTGPSGVLVYNNTFVSPDSALIVATSAASHNFAVENNLFVTRSALVGTRIVDWTAPIDGGRFESDGWYPPGSFRFNLPPAGLTSFADLAALQAAGIETQGLNLVEPIFASGLVAPASYTVTLAPQDVTLAAGSNAIDAASTLANVNDAFIGTAPDLGALERGCPLPIYGVRSVGVDESNEPFGCAP